jgi:hypothetical protein
VSEEADLKAAYQRLDEAIRDAAKLEGADGVHAEWIVVYACQNFDDDGDALTQIGTLVPDGGGHAPHHRLMGLLDYALTRMRAEVAEA